MGVEPLGLVHLGHMCRRRLPLDQRPDSFPKLSPFGGVAKGIVRIEHFRVASISLVSMALWVRRTLTKARAGPATQAR